MNLDQIPASSSKGKSEFSVWESLFGGESNSQIGCMEEYRLYCKYRREIRSLRRELGIGKKEKAASVFIFAWFRICGSGGELASIRDFNWFNDRNARFVRSLSRLSYHKNPKRFAELARKNRGSRSVEQKEAARKYAREYARNKAKTDPIWRARKVMRTRIGAAMARCGGVKSKKTMQLVGCDVSALRSHIEKQFKPGMTWENYGKFGWHIDHIKPCSAFDLTDPAQAEECFHFTNLQPLWAFENLSKGDRF